ncbi:hypothetical protein ACFSSA_14980 [Luteolibacter algae]|uniref:Uncharacterized protein n=1 Tax=Luteolibacter algae TaxID=454151 RepID=A0ABW5DA24_9BACT
MVRSLPNPSALRKEVLETMQRTLGRAGEVLPHQWVGRESGQPSDPNYHLGFNLRVEKGSPAARGKVWQIRAIIKSAVYPHEARQAIWSLRRNPAQDENGVPIYPLLVAPHISESVARICEENEVGWLDLAGNCNLEFGGLWFHVEKEARVYQEARVLKSIFTPKASRLLRVLLKGPLRPWKVEQLAEIAGVSLGLVSKVRKVLLDQELAQDGPEGIRITEAGKLLTDWLRKDDFSKRTSVREYSTLVSGEELADRLIRYGAAHSEEPLFTLNYAAWLRAPHNVPTVVSAYVKRFPDDDEIGYELKARPVQRGAGNLRLLVHEDHHALTIDSQRVKEGRRAVLVSDVQLYLDLHQAEPNGAEQAEVLRKLDDFSGGWT